MCGEKHQDGSGNCGGCHRFARRKEYHVENLCEKQKNKP
jgi:hypothetical protein